MEGISVIIPAHNEEKYIVNTVKSVLNTNCNDIDIIVVCNGCTDNTYLKASMMQSKPVKVLSLPKASVSAARNLGEKHAKYSNLVFLDADTHVSKNAFDIIQKYFSDSIVGTLKVYPWPNKLIGRIMFALKNFIIKYIPVYPTSNGIIFTTKTMFDKIGGFDESLVKREDGVFVRTGRKLGKFVILTKAYVSTSMRRYEKKGYLMHALFWVKDWFLWIFGKSKQEYEVIR